MGNMTNLGRDKIVWFVKKEGTIYRAIHGNELHTTIPDGISIFYMYHMKRWRAYLYLNETEKYYSSTYNTDNDRFEFTPVELINNDLLQWELENTISAQL